MAEANDKVGIIFQNLIDAGCDKTITAKCMSIVQQGSYTEMIPILSQHRAALLSAVRSGQKKIDCLDFLIHKINRNNI